jgi:uncharacterized membrane protein
MSTKYLLENKRKITREKVMNLTYRLYFLREFNRLTPTDFKIFVNANRYFLGEIDESNYTIEFKAFHFHKWLSVIGIKTTKQEIIEFIQEKESEDG